MSRRGGGVYIRAAAPACVQIDVEGAAVSGGGERREAVQLGAGRCAEVGAGRPIRGSSSSWAK